MNNNKMLIELENITHNAFIAFLIRLPILAREIIVDVIIVKCKCVKKIAKKTDNFDLDKA